MIKPVTYQGVYNFKSNLYALEVKSRFIDQNHADGYYTGYGTELALTVRADSVTVGSGALLVQGRMHEIDADGADVAVPIVEGNVGYICARIETYHIEDDENCTLVVKEGSTLAGINLTQQDTYTAASETTNRAYELPLYSFAIVNGVIANVVKLIKPIADYTTVKNLADAAAANAASAAQNALSAALSASTAQGQAGAASSQAAAANQTAAQALETARNALDRVVTQMGGTIIYRDGLPVETLDIGVVAQTVAYAFGCAEADKAHGYTKGGGIDKKFKELEKDIALAAMFTTESEHADRASGYEKGGTIDKMFKKLQAQIAQFAVTGFALSGQSGATIMSGDSIKFYTSPFQIKVLPIPDGAILQSITATSGNTSRITITSISDGIIKCTPSSLTTSSNTTLTITVKSIYGQTFTKTYNVSYGQVY